jgi:AhpD family alkylhydroperoxidase
MYQENDLKRIPDLKALAPKDFSAWVNLDAIVGRQDGRIRAKDRELIAVAVAHTAQCPCCIQVHTKNARKQGASKEELAEAIFVAAALRSSGAAAAHGAMALRFYDEV